MEMFENQEIVDQADAEESGINVAETGPLPFFGYCSEIHSSTPPNFLPEVGESEEQAKQLFSHPAVPDRLW